MKNIVVTLIRDEKGQAMLLAVILLLVGGLIVASLLSFVGTGLLIGPVYEGRVTELYAADAGVEDAAWKIQKGEVPVCPGDPIWSYNISDVNGKVVQVTIEYLGEGTYRITSIAVTDDGGDTASISATTVEAYVSPLAMNFSALLDHAIVSYDTIQVQPGNVVNGDIWLPNEDDLTIKPASTEPEAVINGTIKDNDDLTITWPTVEQLSGYYLDQVDPSNPYPYNSIDITYTKNIGPCYIEGDFVVDNTGDPDTLILDGTVYVAGDLDFWQPGESKNYTVNLNGQTIFAEGSITFPPHRVSISGSGCIIAVGDINFQPGIASGGDDFVLVMSITGEVNFQPSGDFTGCVAGNAHVELQPGCTINWIDPEGKGINFPMGGGGNNQSSTSGLRIDSWEVNQL